MEHNDKDTEAEDLKRKIKSMELSLQEARNWAPERFQGIMGNVERLLATSAKTLELREVTVTKLDALSVSVMTLVAKMERQSTESASLDKVMSERHDGFLRAMDASATKMEAFNAVWLSELRRNEEKAHANFDAYSKRIDDTWKSVQMHSKMFMWVVGGALAIGLSAMMFLHSSNQKAIEAQSAQTSRYIEKLADKVDSIDKSRPTSPPAAAPQTPATVAPPVVRPIYRPFTKQQTTVILAPCCSNNEQSDAK